MAARGDLKVENSEAEEEIDENEELHEVKEDEEDEENASGEPDPKKARKEDRHGTISADKMIRALIAGS